MTQVTNVTLPATASAIKKKSGVANFFIRLVKEKPLGLVGGVVVFILLLLGVFANILAPYGFNEIHLKDRMQPPSITYWLGTDSLGRDVLSRIIFGARISVVVGLGASAIATVLAAVIGLVSGFIGGKFDITVQRFVDAWLAFPSMIILLTGMALMGTGVLQITLVLGVAVGINSSRLIRSRVLAMREYVFVQAVKAIGANTSRVLLRHMLPNVMPLLIILFTVDIAGMIVGEAALSFLGFGVPPPQPSWGGMLSAEGRSFMLQAPWLAFWPGLALSVVVYGINMFGDAVRDLLDPRLRGGGGRYSNISTKKIAKQLAKGGMSSKR
jgi:peptide/nickel transport system permease protein